jgi:hypothetical protein
MTRDRCYDFKNIFAETFGENVGTFYSQLEYSTALGKFYEHLVHIFCGLFVYFCPFWCIFSVLVYFFRFGVFFPFWYSSCTKKNMATLLSTREVQKCGFCEDGFQFCACDRFSFLPMHPLAGTPRVT